MPKHINVARAIGGNRSASIDSPGAVDQITLRLERRATLVQACIQHGRPIVAGVRRGARRSIPCDMHNIVATERNAGAADVPDRYGAARFTVYAYRL
jgi:hypothetical protein